MLVIKHVYLFDTLEGEKFQTTTEMQRHFTCFHLLCLYEGFFQLLCKACQTKYTHRRLWWVKAILTLVRVTKKYSCQLCAHFVAAWLFIFNLVYPKVQAWFYSRVSHQTWYRHFFLWFQPCPTDLLPEIIALIQD